jgi:hypothetical protein
VNTATISVRGVFVVTDHTGTDITPRKRKERGLLALIAMAPQKRRSRNWIKTKLWSERDPKQAAGSLRRALCDLRIGLGQAGGGLCSDRNDIWFGETIDVIDNKAFLPKSELLETIDVADPEFEDWLRDLRYSDQKPVLTPVAPPVARQGPHTLVLVDVRTQSGNSEDVFLTSFLTDTLSNRLMAESSVEVLVGDTIDRKRMMDAETILRFELVSVISSGRWNVHMRAFADRNRRFIWAGRLNLPMDFRTICEGPEVAAFVSNALSAIRLKYQSHKLANRSHYLMLQRATQRLFSSDQEQFALAEAELIDVSTRDAGGIPLAWRAFGRLTQVLELGLNPMEYMDETEALLADAQLRSPGNPLVLGLASHIHLKMMGDVDRGMHLAQSSLQSCDQNPYAMLAISQAYFHAADYAQAHETAVLGQRMADGMPNAFFWNMQACLTALGVGDLAGALDAGTRAHAQNNGYRPALRYLTALSLLERNYTRAEYYAGILRRLEPGFIIVDLTKPDYPMHTLRLVGLMDALEGSFAGME